jgi:preprotein translocase subunit SecD
MKPHQILILILSITLLALWIDLPKNLPVNLTIFNQNINFSLSHPEINTPFFKRSLELKKGLDIQGGVEVVLEADVNKIEESKRDQALESAKNVLTQRVDLFGVVEPVVKVSKVGDSRRIIVQLPGVDDPAKALELIGQTAKLEFASPIYNEEATVGAQLVGFAPTDLTGADLLSASVTWETQDRKPAVSIEFNEEGKQKFADLTKQYLEEPLAITLDGEIVSAPTVQSEITDGKAIISGNFTTEESKLLVTQLNAGALPVDIKVLSQKNIPPTLGQESINKSIAAGLVGLATVAIFMILMYQGLGLIATLGLVIYAILTFALYKLIPITLTLPGIAGFILSVGMAVDSNILIFERYKEEKHDGRSTPVALELAFGRAWDSIKDANLATIITAFILFNPLDWTFLNTSGPVRGFALTLILGILISLFTGIIVTRTFLRLLVRK